MDIENGKLIDESPKIEKPRNSSKIYFFILAILALLATNVYYAVRYKNLGREVAVLNSEKNQLEIEVDRIEAELNRITGENIDLVASFKAEHDSARALIADLRRRLDASPAINQADLLNTQQEIRRLRDLVQKYSDDLENQRKENSRLIQERNELQASVHNYGQRLTQLQQKNDGLEGKIKLASNLTISELNIIGLRKKSGDQVTAETKARRVDKLQINFTLANNTLAAEKTYNIYLRLTEPSGNLITEGKLFRINNEDIQYTATRVIDFRNDGKQYSMEWAPSDYDFQKGTYTVILYSDESVMGRSTINLK